MDAIARFIQACETHLQKVGNARFVWYSHRLWNWGDDAPESHQQEWRDAVREASSHRQQLEQAATDAVPRIRERGGDPADVFRILDGATDWTEFRATMKELMPTLRAMSNGPVGEMSCKRRTANERIIDAIYEDPTRREWTAKQFASHVNCSEKTVLRTAMWKSLQEAKAVSKSRLQSRT